MKNNLTTFATLLIQSGQEPIKVMKVGGWSSLKTMQIYVRNAGVDIDGIMDDFELHDHNQVNGKVLDLFPEPKMIENVQ